MAEGAPAIDPATGLPVPQTPPWKDPAWPEPNIMLTNVVYDSLPLSEVVLNLRDQFKEQFDVLLPVNLPGTDPMDPGSIQIRLRLKNVTASEVFNAMNLVFENDRTPVRWELKMNGKRPIALLRLLTEPSAPYVPQPPPPPTKRMVYFVGDLIGDEKAGGMTMKQVVDTITEVCQMTYGKDIGVQFHKEAQLVVASGSHDQIVFIEQALSALRARAELGRNSQPKPSESRPKAEAMKPGGFAAPK